MEVPTGPPWRYFGAGTAHHLRRTMQRLVVYLFSKYACSPLPLLANMMDEREAWWVFVSSSYRPAPWVRLLLGSEAAIARTSCGVHDTRGACVLRRLWRSKSRQARCRIAPSIGDSNSADYRCSTAVCVSSTHPFPPVIEDDQCPAIKGRREGAGAPRQG